MDTTIEEPSRNVLIFRVGLIVVRVLVVALISFEAFASSTALVTRGNASSANPTIGEDGLDLAFESRATNLVAGDTSQGEFTNIYEHAGLTGCG